MVVTRWEEEDSMAMGPERSNSKPLHNFMMPCLKWGTQRHLRCTKLASDSSADAGDRRSPAPRFLGDDGIDAVREKLMLDLKTEADRMKDAILGKEVAEDNDVLVEDAPPHVPPDEEPTPPVTGVRTWNLRTRRAPVAGDKAGVGSSSPLRTHTAAVAVAAAAWKTPKLRRSPEKEERPVKFSLTVTKKEIEEDFMKMVGHRPPRRPKKRPRNVQKQLDTLFPGQWLSEVSADSYKVPDDAETGKR